MTSYNASAEDKSELLRLVRRIDRRIALVGHLIGMGGAGAFGYFLAKTAQQSFSISDDWAWGIGVAGFLVIGSLFNRDFNRD